jgi:hypothetical protein
MGSRGAPKQVIGAFKDWVNDTPLRIVGWIMGLIALIGGAYLVIPWALQNFPPIRVWIGIVFVLFGIVWLSFIPYYKRRNIKSHLKDKDTLIRAINRFQITARDAIIRQKIMEMTNVGKLISITNNKAQVEILQKQLLAFVEAYEALTGEILVAGGKIKDILDPIVDFAIKQVFSGKVFVDIISQIPNITTIQDKINSFTKSPDIKLNEDEFMLELEKKMKEAISQINELAS